MAWPTETPKLQRPAVNETLGLSKKSPRWDVGGELDSSKRRATHEPASGETVTASRAGERGQVVLAVRVQRLEPPVMRGVGRMCANKMGCKQASSAGTEPRGGKSRRRPVTVYYALTTPGDLDPLDGANAKGLGTRITHVVPRRLARGRLQTTPVVDGAFGCATLLSPLAYRGARLSPSTQSRARPNKPIQRSEEW